MKARRDYNILGSYERRFSLATRVVRDKTKYNRKREKDRINKETKNVVYE